MKPDGRAPRASLISGEIAVIHESDRHETSAERLPAALHALALRLGGVPYAGLSSGASRRITFACNGLADLIRSGEDNPDTGMNLRGSAGFLLSALGALRWSDGAPPLSGADEAWLVAEIEAEFGEALALFEVRTGRTRSPVPPRPLLARAWIASAPDLSREEGTP
jgi:hypothetical protein